MEQNTPTTTPITDKASKNSGNGLKIATAIASAMAVCGIAFGIYGMVQSAQKDNQVSDLKVELNDKTVKIAELETEISNLNNKTDEITIDTEVTATAEPDDNKQPTSNSNNETAAIHLEAMLDKNDERTVFKVGNCTADGPSVKCPVTINGKDALISYTSTDSVLRLTLPND